MTSPLLASTVAHGPQSSGHEIESSPELHTPSPHEPPGPRNAVNDAMSPFQRSTSASSLIPEIEPVSVYCQNDHVVHGSAIVGHDALVYCACHSGEVVSSPPPTWSSQK